MFDVQAGSCYKVRLGNENESSPAGTLAIACGVQGCPFESVCSENPDFCNDNNVCTQDICDEVAEGCCIYNDLPCPAPGSCAVLIGCDPVVGCLYDSVCAVNPNHCNDGNLCTFDVCDDTANGCCMHTPVNCDDNNDCTNDLCEPLLGCRYQPAEPLPLNCATIPTVSEWGLVVLALLVLVVGKVSFGWRGETTN